VSRKAGAIQKADNWVKLQPVKRVRTSQLKGSLDVLILNFPYARARAGTNHEAMPLST